MEYPVRVLLAVTKMDRGGIENRLMEMLRAIDRSRVIFDFYCCRKEKGLYDDEIASLGGRVFHSNPYSPTGVGIAKRWRTFLIAHPEYRIVHAHSNQFCGYILKGAAEAGVPVRIAQSHTALGSITPKNLVKNYLKRNAGKYATHKVAVSIDAAIWLFGKESYESGDIVIRPNAFDVDRFVFNEKSRDRLRLELGLENSFCLMHTGNFRFVKNHAFLLKVFTILAAMRDDARLILVGDGKDRDNFELYARSAGIDNKVLFLGQRDDVPDLLSAADLFVFPSIYEGYPGALLEAEASGLTAFVSDSITKEVDVTGNVKFLSLSDTAYEWAKVISEYIPGDRSIEKSLFSERGLDISKAASELCDFYIQSVK